MPKQRSKFQTWIEYLALRAILGALGLFPYRISLKIGKMTGITLSMLIPRFKRIALRNLEIAMPENSEARNREIVHGTFASIGRHIGFISHFRRFDKTKLKELVDVVGADLVAEADQSERGLIFITGHFGSWEVFNLFPLAHGYDINILVRRLDNHLAEEFIDSLRTQFGSVTLGKKKAARKLYRLLSEGKIVGILADLNTQLHDGVFVDFFGVPAATTKSIAKLAIKTNPTILPAFAVWEAEEEKYRVYIEPPIKYEITGDSEKDILRITQSFTEVIEKYVRKYPEQWLWIHKRWKTRPKGEDGLY